MSVSRISRLHLPNDTVRVRRAYFDSRYGQLHVRTAFPASGGFDERTALLCIHPSNASGRVFDALLPRIGVDRSVYAPDIPGCGESDPRTPLPASERAEGVIDFLDTMRLRRIDLLSSGDGEALAAELARSHPQVVVRQVVLSAADLAALESRPDDIVRQIKEALDKQNDFRN
jgi:pimeloyl-ACP methyl ester carboxylesterase